jgi:hypothetical protein
MRPYYLDGDLAQHDLTLLALLAQHRRSASILQGPVIPVISRRLSMAADLWLLCSFQGPWRGFTPVGLRVMSVTPFQDVSSR